MESFSFFSVCRHPYAWREKLREAMGVAHAVVTPITYTLVIFYSFSTFKRQTHLFDTTKIWFLSWKVEQKILMNHYLIIESQKWIVPKMFENSAGVILAE